MKVALYSEKECFKCRVSKPLSEFYTHPAMADGHLGKCKDCTRAGSRAHRTQNLEKVRAYDRGRGKLPHRLAANREYQKTAQGKAAHAAATARYREAYPLRRAAHIAVGNAVRDGALLRGACEVCGDVEVEAHHDDYAKPLEVRWLCVKHHKEWHNQ